MHKPNIDPEEVHKFTEIAATWWDTQGHFQALHDINPLRMEFINQQVNLANQEVLDVGCGGGILCESLAKQQANVTGIDIVEQALQVAKLHAIDSELKIDYVNTTAEDYAKDMAGQFDIVTCLEMLEHVPNPISVVNACRKLIKPGGSIFFSTFNRTPLAYLQAIIGAEYCLDLLPQGTHDFAKFIRPSELANWLRKLDLKIVNMQGLHYNPWTKDYYLSDQTNVNYLLFAKHD